MVHLTAGRLPPHHRAIKLGVSKDHAKWPHIARYCDTIVASDFMEGFGVMIRYFFLGGGGEGGVLAARS